MAFLNGTTFTPLLLTYKNEAMYLHLDPQGGALFSESSPEPFYRIQEPLLLAQGVMTDSKTVHLVTLKTSGELCYTLISGPSTSRTTLIAKLDVRATRYRQLFLFLQGKTIHIFYAYSHQTNPRLWRIEHRYWDGHAWHSVHLGEVVHPRLYHVNLDSKGNIHLLTMAFQGQHTLLFTNRYNGTFQIWGSPTETLKILGEVMDMTSLMTSVDDHHLFWVVKTKGLFELHSALRADAYKLTNTWHCPTAPIKVFDSPTKSIGALEINGVLWLLVRTKEEILLQNDGNVWKLFLSHPPLHRSLQWVHNGETNCQQTYWLEDQAEGHTPAYYKELELTIKKQPKPLSEAFQTPPPPSIPAFYPNVLSPSQLPPTLSTVNESNTLNPTDTKTDDDILHSVAHNSLENPKLFLTLDSLLSKFDQILGVISENVIQSKQPPPEETGQIQAIADKSLEQIKQLKEALSDLERENQRLSQDLGLMLSRQKETDSSIDRLELIICQLHEGISDCKHKGGFWKKWFT